METITIVAMTLLVVATALSAHTAYQWRKLALDYKSFIENPNVQQVDKQQEYKDTFEAQINALDEERRQISVAMNEVYDVLDEEAQKSDDPRLMQARNVLLRAIAISTYGR